MGGFVESIVWSSLDNSKDDSCHMLSLDNSRMIPNTIPNIIQELWQESNPTVELILLGNVCDVGGTNRAISFKTNVHFCTCQTHRIMRHKEVKLNLGYMEVCLIVTFICPTPSTEELESLWPLKQKIHVWRKRIVEV